MSYNNNNNNYYNNNNNDNMSYHSNNNSSYNSENANELHYRRNEKSNESMENHYFYESKLLNNEGLWFQGPNKNNNLLNIESNALFKVSLPPKDNWCKVNEEFDYLPHFESHGKEIGLMDRYVYFNHSCTDALLDMINVFPKKQYNNNNNFSYYNNNNENVFSSDFKVSNNNNNNNTGVADTYYEENVKSKVYQFEANSFRYNVLTGNIRFVSIYSNVSERSNEPLKFMIFRLASHRFHETPLFGLGRLNVDNEINIRKSQKGGSRKYGYNNNQYNNNNNHYNNNNNQNAMTAKYRLCGMYTKQGMLKFFEAFTKQGSNLNKNNYFENILFPNEVSYQTPLNTFDPSIEIELCNEMKNKLKDGLSYKHYNNNSYENNNSYDDKGGFSKMERLREIIIKNMGIHPNKAYNKIEEAIKESIKFAQKNPETVLSQVYLDCKFARFHFEYVLYCELKWYKHIKLNNGKNIKKACYYKFGLPIMEIEETDENNNIINKRYIIKSILTTKMAMDNIGLNNPKLRFKNEINSKWWFSSLENETYSFYEYYKNLQKEEKQRIKNNNNNIVTYASKVANLNQNQIKFEQDISGTEGFNDNNGININKNEMVIHIGLKENVNNGMNNITKSLTPPTLTPTLTHTSFVSNSALSTPKFSPFELPTLTLGEVVIPQLAKMLQGSNSSTNNVLKTPNSVSMIKKQDDGETSSVMTDGLCKDMNDVSVNDENEEIYNNDAISVSSFSGSSDSTDINSEGGLNDDPYMIPPMTENKRRSSVVVKDKNGNKVTNDEDDILIIKPVSALVPKRRKPPLTSTSRRIL